MSVFAKDNDMEHAVRFVYRNWKNEVAVRIVVPKKVEYGTDDFHKGDGVKRWMLIAYDLERNDLRHFVLWAMLTPMIDAKDEIPQEWQEIVASGGVVKRQDSSLRELASSDWFADVLKFHETMNILINDIPKIPGKDTQILRESLEQEEWTELLEADDKKYLPGVADGIVDLIYVLIGRAVSYGIDLRPLWDEVQRANMAKVGGPVRADGKRLKPEGWYPPDIAGLLAKQKPLSRRREM